MADRTFNLWVFGDAHVGTERRHGWESLSHVLQQSETGLAGAPPFDWDMAVDVGDMSGDQGLPSEAEGREIVRQFAALRSHPREAIYSVCGNHDRSGISEPPNHWWRRWIDPTGEHTADSGVNAARRPFPIEGSWERYAVRVGNLLFLMMSDINEPSQRVGRDHLGGNPAGVVSGETFDWWRGMVESNPECLILSVHHYMLRDTTVASGPWEGMLRNPDGSWMSGYHGFKPQGAPEGASYLYFVGGRPNAGAFEDYLAARPGAVSFWLGGHTHTHPDDTYGGKSHVETKWGTHFINCAAVTRHHCCQCHPGVPMSRVFSFTEGSDRVRIRCYLHTDHFAAPGWYQPAERTVTLRRPFRAPRTGIRPGKG